MHSIFHFTNDELGYLKWLAANEQHGFVLNIRHPASNDKLMLHRSSCGTIRGEGNAPYTTGLYTKLCSGSGELIVEWARANLTGVTGHGRLCGKCKPELPLSPGDQAAEMDAALVQKASKALRGNASARQARLAKASPHPEERLVLTRVFVRNPDVVAEVLYQASGVCEGCNKPAPFERKATGEPYLEVHHLKPLADGGEDIVENAIALCPNCHRHRHYG